MSVFQQMVLMRHLSHLQIALKGEPSTRPMEFKLLWALGVLGLHETYFGDGDGHFRKPSIAQIIHVEKLLVQLDPTGDLLLFNNRSDDSAKYLLTVSY
jgi:hypothetical protein